MIAYLMIMVLASTSGSWQRSFYAMPDMAACERAVASSKIDMAKGGDAEAAAIMVCLPQKEFVVLFTNDKTKPHTVKP